MPRIDARDMKSAFTTTLGAALLLVPVTAQSQRGDLRGEAPPPPAVWLESGPELAPGQPARLGYDLPGSGYLTILRANTNGDLSVIYPERPNNRSRPGDRGALPMRADPAPGVGYLFWVTSPTPFDFRAYRARGGNWSTGGLGERGDPFEQVDHFARGTTHGRYSVGYSSYRVGGAGRGERRAPAVHDGDYADGPFAPRGEGAYGYGGYGDYAGWWGGPQWNGYGSDTWRYRRSWRDREDERAYDRAAQNDPRSRYMRHCADGTLAPYTVACGAGGRRPH